MGNISLNKANRLIFTNIAGMLIITGVLFFGIFQALGLYTRHGEVIALPSLKGLSVDEAAQILKAKGLDVQVSDSTYSPGKPADCVLAQSPEPGELMKAGRTVYLTINSLSVPMQNVPDIINKTSVRQATADLISAGFKLTEDEHTDGTRDWVYGIEVNGRSLASGERAPVGATLTLIVGNGYHSQAVQSDSSFVHDDQTEENPMDDDMEDVTPSNIDGDAGAAKASKVKTNNVKTDNIKPNNTKPANKASKSSTPSNKKSNSNNNNASKSGDNSWF